MVGGKRGEWGERSEGRVEWRWQSTEQRGESGGKGEQREERLKVTAERRAGRAERRWESGKGRVR